MKRLILSVVVMVLLGWFLLSGVVDTGTSIADTNVPSNKATSSISETRDSSSPASATITITTYALPDEYASQQQIREGQNNDWMGN